MNSPVFYLRLRPVPGHMTPPVVRLRGALKELLRRFGLRCERVTMKDDQAAGNASGEAVSGLQRLSGPTPEDQVEAALASMRDQDATVDRLVAELRKGADPDGQ